MSESRLHELLADLVADVDSPPMTQRAWRAGRRSRRQRIAVTGAVGAVLLVGAGVAVVERGLTAGLAPAGPTAATTSAPPPPAFADPRVEVGPLRAAVGGLPAMSVQVSALSRIPSSAQALSGNPMSKIVAAAQPANRPVLALGNDGAWREVDGVPATPPLSLTSASISPDARRLALLRGDGLLLVDATTGDCRTLSVPATFGRIDELTWMPDGESVAVSGDSGSGVVSTIDGSYRPTGARPGLAVGGPGDPVVQLTKSELVQDAGAGERQAYKTGDKIALSDWYGPGWVNNSVVASTWFLGDAEQAVVLISATTAQVTHVLTLPTGAAPAVRSNGCCTTLGWLDDQTVLLRDGGQVLAWRFTTGTVSRVAQLPGTATRGADPAYDTVIATAQP